MADFDKKDEEVRHEIAEWFVEGVRRGATHMLVVRDSMTDETIHPYVMPDEEVLKRYHLYQSDKTFEVVEIYSLAIDMVQQIAEERAWHMEGLH